MKKWLTMIIGLFALNTHAMTFYVDASVAPGGDGASWGTAYCFLQDALDQTVAERNDEVWIADGTYHPDDGLNVTEGDRTASFHIKDSVTLYGGFDGGETSLLQRDLENYRSILSGEIFSEKIFWSLHICHAINATFDGIEIIRGNANGSGEHEHSGAVVGVGDLFANNCLFSENSAAGDGGVTDASDAVWTVENCTFSNNSTEGFGGVANSGVWIVDSCSFEKNSAYYGGVANYGTWSASNCVFSKNTAERGGVANNGFWSLNNCTFFNNSARRWSGGVANEGEWVVDSCTFSGNSAVNGRGGVANYGAWTIENSIFYGNLAGYGGVASKGIWTVNDSTFSENSAGYGGGGVASEGAWTVNNSTFFGNSTVNYAANGGVASEGIWMVENCIFSENSAERGGVAYDVAWTVENSTFSRNSAHYGGVASGGTWMVNNSTFSGNSARNDDGGVARGGIWTAYNSIFTGEGIFRSADFSNQEIQEFPSPSGKRARNIIIGGTNALPADANIGSPDWIIDADPLFVNTNNLIGADGVWRTADDGLRLQTNSPAIGQGNEFFLPLDTYDMDNDGVTNEPTPLDIANFLRVQNETLDLGAYEYGDSTEVLYTLNILSSTGGTTEPSGMKNYSDGASTSILASAISGYLFDSWSGNIASSSNPLNLTMHSNITVTANFAQDSTDPDNDGLSNYEEAVVHGSNPLLPDTSGDGILDGEAVDAGANPLIDHSNILQIVQNRPGGFDLYSDDTIHDLNVGKLMIQPAGSGRFSIRYTVEESTNLQTWTVYETFEREFTNATPKAYIRVHGREPQ